MVAGNIAEGLTLAAQHTERPGRFGRNVDQVIDAYLRWNGHAIFDVAVTLSDNVQIDGEHERAAFGRAGARDEFADKATVLHNVKLEPERLVDRGCDILDRADRHRALGKGNAGGLRGAAGVNLAVAMLH